MTTTIKDGDAADPIQRGHDEVTVELNGEPVKIHRGSYSTPELKAALGVDQNLDLDLFVDGKFVTLTDSDRTVVKEGMVFVSHVRHGGSA